LERKRREDNRVRFRERIKGNWKERDSSKDKNNVRRNV
jgi:hypothetical protein